jgi:hypothetical protein
MRTPLTHLLVLLGLSVSLAAGAQAPRNGGDFSQNPQGKKLPTNVILVKGAWSSASDSATPLPEGGTVNGQTYDNRYFGLALPLPAGWLQKYEGPPPSDSGYYVLAQLRPGDSVQGKSHGTLLIAAQDLFFTQTRATGALQLINYTRDHLRADYKVERAPSSVTIAGHSFIRLAFGSPVAGLHWSLLATQIRCHVVEFVFTSADNRLLDTLQRGLSDLKLPPQSDTASDEAPVCIKDYANDDNVIERVDPIFSEQRYNPVPVRVIIDRQGKVKHIHFLSAFPAQAQAISTALQQWQFKPYLRNGQPVEVETGILFGRIPRGAL